VIMIRRCLAVAVCMLPVLGRAQVSSPQAAGGPLRGLELGTRITHTHLLDDSQHYIGHLSELKIQQDYSPTKLFADYFFTDTWGVELTWDSLEAEADNVQGGTEGDADGTLEMSGPILTAVGRMPLDNGWTPYAGAGFALLNGRFDTATWWKKGYSSEADWISMGRPNENRGGKRRRLSVDDTVGYVLTGGADCALTENWAIGFYGRLLFAEADASVQERLAHSVVKRIDGSFDVNNLALGLTVRYSFL
jgi:outer membrane protein W